MPSGLIHPTASTLAQGPALPAPAGKRAPFGWPVAAVPTLGGGSLTLSWVKPPATATASALRITTGIDDRECKRIAVRTTEGRVLGEFDLRFAHALETFSLPLPADLPSASFTSGLVLEMTTGTSPLWLLAPAVAAEAPGMAPHLLDAAAPIDPVEAFLNHLHSPDCQHTWGWMEGCVLDGLERLHAVYPERGYDTVRRAHLARFFTADGRLLSETPRSQPHDDAIDNIESTVMFAALASADPRQPWLDRAVAYWRHEAGADGAVLDGAMLSAEGSYTIGWPMARLATLRNDAALATAALRQLEIRREQLWHEDNFWLRWYPANHDRTFRNWARGLAWHFLGSVRTAQELAGDPRLDAVIADLRRLTELVLRHQRADGLWNCFIDDPQGTPDTSGSAGIGAALALAGAHGWIEAKSARTAASRTWRGLLPHLTADGRLGGVSQSNRGGEELQRSTYRVLSAMGAGLAAQLHATLQMTDGHPRSHA